MQLELIPEGLSGKLVHVIEECSEVIKEACKAQRFGLKNYHPRDPDRITNKDRLYNEITQLKEAINRLELEIHILESNGVI